MKQYVKKVFFEVQWVLLRLRIAVAHIHNSKIVFILGTADHRNIGDLAITNAEVEFINSIDKFKAIPVSTPLLEMYKKRLLSVIKRSDLIAGHGGGNLGNTYPNEESVRRFFIESFPDNKIVILPQTVHFDNTDDGRQFREQTVAIYGRHKSLTLIARERISYHVAIEAFKNNKVVLTPDIVLSLKVRKKDEKPRKGVLLCFRNDVEKTLTDIDTERIMSFAHEVSSDIRITDTVSTDSLFALRVKKKIVLRKLAEFQHAELVITDRLHGMVFAAITGTPCIVFSNFNHKVQGTYEWIKDLGYVSYCQSIDELGRIDVRQLTSSTRQYDPGQFSDYWDIIQKEIEART